MIESLRVEYRKVETLIPFARNPRTHSDAQVAKLAASIVEFGWTNPILVDGSQGIIAGHGRLAAARKLGLAEVPVIELGHLTLAQKRAYVIADNRLALDAGWDEEMLSIAERLGEGIDFVRVDLYASDDWVHVGELTLYPGGGFENYQPAEYDRILGDQWALKPKA